MTDKLWAGAETVHFLPVDLTESRVGTDENGMVYQDIAELEVRTREGGDTSIFFCTTRGVRGGEDNLNNGSDVAHFRFSPEEAKALAETIHPQAAQYKALVEAAVDILACNFHMTSEDFEQGRERNARHALTQALEALGIPTGAVCNSKRYRAVRWGEEEDRRERCPIHGYVVPCSECDRLANTP